MKLYINHYNTRDLFKYFFWTHCLPCMFSATLRCPGDYDICTYVMIQY